MEKNKFSKILDLEGVEIASDFETSGITDIPEINLAVSTMKVETKSVELRPLKPYEITWCIVEANDESKKILSKIFTNSENTQYNSNKAGKHYQVDFIDKTFTRLNEMEDFFVTMGRNSKMEAMEAIEHYEKWKHVFVIRRFGI